MVTGHTGFKGTWLTRWLSLMGADVLGYSLPCEWEQRHFSLLKPPCDSVFGDVGDESLVAGVVADFKPDLVFHLAAQALVRTSYEKPVETFRTNIMGTVHILDACRKAGSVKGLINVTSDKCYLNRPGPSRGFREYDRLGGSDPYSTSKSCSELITSSYRDAFFNGPDNDFPLIASVRAGNVVGGGDWAEDRIVPDMMKAAEKEALFTIRNPGSIRPWQHVLDPLSGYLLLGQKLLEGKKEFGDAWNFGPSEDESVTVMDLARYMQQCWGEIRFRERDEPPDTKEAYVLLLDSSKARTHLKWKNIWDTRKAFEVTVDWYKAFLKHNEVKTEAQMNTYFADAEKVGAVWI